MLPKLVIVQTLLICVLCCGSMIAQTMPSNQWEWERVVLTPKVESVDDAIEQYLIEYATLPNERIDYLFAGRQPIAYSYSRDTSLAFSIGRTHCEMLLSNAATPEAASQLVSELCSRIPLAGFFDHRDQLKKMAKDVWSELLEKSENEDRSSRRKFETDSYLFELGVTYYPQEGQPPRLWIYRTINGFSDRWSKVSSKVGHTGYAVRVTPQEKLDELREKLFPAMQLTGYWKNAATWQLCVLSSENNQTTFYHAATRWPVVIRRNFDSDPDRWSEIRVEYSSKKPKDDGAFAFIQGLKSIRWYGVEDGMPNYIEFWKRPNSFSTEILEIEKRRESIEGMMIDTIRFRPKK